MAAAAAAAAALRGWLGRGGRAALPAASGRPPAPLLVAADWARPTLGPARPAAGLASRAKPRRGGVATATAKSRTAPGQLADAARAASRSWRRSKEHYRAKIRARYGDVLPGEEQPGTPSFFSLLHREPLVGFASAAPPAAAAATKKRKAADAAKRAGASSAAAPPAVLDIGPVYAGTAPTPAATAGSARDARADGAASVAAWPPGVLDFGRVLAPAVDKEWLAAVTPLLYSLPFPGGYFARLDEFERVILKMRFRQPSLLLQIFLHDSFLFRVPGIQPAKRDLLLSLSNLRLSYVGDTILNLMLTSLLLQQHAGDKLNDWSHRASHMRSNQYLKHLAVHEFHMDRLLLVGNSSVYKEGKIAADAMEALIGAIYIDQGLETAAEFVNRRMLPQLTQLYEARRALDATETAPSAPDERDAYFRDRLDYVPSSGPNASPAPTLADEVPKGGDHVAEEDAAERLSGSASDASTATNATSSTEPAPN